MFKRIHFFGLTIHCSSFQDLFFLLREIFIEESYYIKLKKEDPVIVDCGANIGDTVLFFKQLYPSSHIQAFEPTPAIFSLLEKNVSVNKFKDITLERVAVSDYEGTAKIYEKDDQGIANTIIEKEAQGEGLTEITVKKLSSYINEPVDLLKLDVEFSEMRVLQDLEKADKLQYINAIVMEYHYLNDKPDARESYSENRFSEVLRILEANNYIFSIHITRVKPSGFARYLIKAHKREKL